MLAFFVKVHSVLAPRVEIRDQFELLAGPGMKWTVIRKRRFRPLASGVVYNFTTEANVFIERLWRSLKYELI